MIVVVDACHRDQIQFLSHKRCAEWKSLCCASIYLAKRNTRPGFFPNLGWFEITAATEFWIAQSSNC